MGVSRQFVQVLVIVASSIGTVEAARVRTGEWTAWLDSPGGDLPFELVIDFEAGQWEAWVSNGEQRTDASRMTVSGSEVVIEFDYFDSQIKAQIGISGTRLDGEWTKRNAGKTTASLPFHATTGSGRRFRSQVGDAPVVPAPQAVEGKWTVTFGKSEKPAIAVFEATANRSVAGTFMTETGDYGRLLGLCDGQRLRMSSFDGGRAMLVDARLQPDGTLVGELWSRDKYHDTWTAKRDDAAELPNGFRMTAVKAGPIDLAALSFKDLDGASKSLAEFGGHVLLIDVFGTWCPNCHDASHFLSELHERHSGRGLAVVGLAFEQSGDFEQDSRQVKRFIARHKSKYPVLLGGVADKKVVAEALPFIEELKAYPTFIIIDRKDGSGNARVVATYAGFSGPATGEAHEQLCRKLTEVVDKALGD